MNKPDRNFRILRANEDRLDWEMPGAQVCIRTIQCPDSTSDVEDAALLVAADADSLLLAVADGVGGHPGGREAAHTVMKALAKCQVSEESSELRSQILDAIEKANQELLEQGRGAATTVAVAEIYKGVLRAYHVGDSEVLAVGQRGKAKLRVVPHSATGFAVEAGMLDEDAAVEHEERHLLLNVIGTAEMRIEMAPSITLAKHDTVLLTTDGVLDNLYMDEIVEIIRCGSLTRAADELCSRARARMVDEASAGPSKPDDIAIVLFRQAKPTTAARRQRKK